MGGELQLVAGLRAVKENRRVREEAGARQMKQPRENRRFKYGVLHEPRRQYVASRGTGSGKKKEGREEGEREQKRRLHLRAVPRCWLETIKVISGGENTVSSDGDMGSSAGGAGMAEWETESGEGGTGDQEAGNDDEAEEAAEWRRCAAGGCDDSREGA